MRPASSRFVARRMPSRVDCPVPKRSLNTRSDIASLTATPAPRAGPARSRERMRSNPVVVSSVAQSTRARSAGTVMWSRLTRSAPSSRVTCGSRATSAATCEAYASASSPRTACTSAPKTLASAAATSSCVDSGLAAHSATSAPPAISARARLAVSAVTCRHAATVMPSSGRSCSSRSRIERRTGICSSAHSTRAWPEPASEGSAMSEDMRAEGPVTTARMAVVPVRSAGRIPQGHLRGAARTRPRDRSGEVGT